MANPGKKNQHQRKKIPDIKPSPNRHRAVMATAYSSGLGSTLPMAADN
jgi:hypothetical protein